MPRRLFTSGTGEFEPGRKVVPDGERKMNVGMFYSDGRSSYHTKSYPVPVLVNDAFHILE